MATVERTLTVPRPIDEVFEYVAAFENIARWDPGTVQSEKLSAGPPRVGSTYQLVVKFGKATVPMRYQTTALDRPLSVTLAGEGERVTSVDSIKFAEADGGTRITYRADIRLKGPARFLEVFARRAINRTADEAMAGLMRALGG